MSALPDKDDEIRAVYKRMLYPTAENCFHAAVFSIDRAFLPHLNPSDKLVRAWMYKNLSDAIFEEDKKNQFDLKQLGGIQYLGATCWLDSLLQVILSVPVRYIYRNILYSSEEIGDNRNCKNSKEIIPRIRNYLRDLKNGLQKGDMLLSCVEIRKLYQSCKEKPEILGNAMELLGWLIGLFKSDTWLAFDFEQVPPYLTVISKVEFAHYKFFELKDAISSITGNITDIIGLPDFFVLSIEYENGTEKRIPKEEFGGMELFGLIFTTKTAEQSGDTHYSSFVKRGKKYYYYDDEDRKDIELREGKYYFKKQEDPITPVSKGHTLEQIYDPKTTVKSQFGSKMNFNPNKVQVIYFYKRD